MKTFLKKYSVAAYFFLIGYFVLHEFNANYGLIKPLVALRFLGLYILIAIILHSISYFIFSSIKLSSLYVFILMCFYLFFGSMHDALKSFTANAFFGSHIFIFSLIGLLVLVFIRIIKKYIKKDGILISYLALLSLILFIWEFILLSYNIISHKEQQNDLAGNSSSEGIFISHVPNEKKPDIFFIVFDSYTSSQCLENDFQFSNSALDSFLLSKGFFISVKSKSNYSTTPLSIASSFDMNYLDNKIANKATAKYLLQGVATVKMSKLPVLLKKNGYRVCNYSCFDLQDHPAHSKAYFAELSERMIDEQTMYGRFRHFLLWNFILTKEKRQKKILPDVLVRSRDQYIRDYITGNAEGLEKAVLQEDTIPKFVYCHIMLPHEPYYFRKDGSFWPDSVFLGESDAKERFIEQTIYANSIIKNIVNNILNKQRRPTVIILEGDHGFRSFDAIPEKDKIFYNLNAFYFDDKDYHLLYDSISPVNSFRVVMNKYFNQQYRLLRDSTVN